MKEMSTAVMAPVEEYLRTSYHPDCDYVDGEVIERNLGERKHSAMQRDIMFFLEAKYGLGRRLFPEQRVQVTSTRFRVPDVCLLGADAPDDDIVTTPPELCIEILSPEDTVTRTLDKIKDYFSLGVPVCWMIDPIGRQGWIATPGHLEDAADGILRAGGIEMPVAVTYFND
jgi:Uma2 family endonuclease